MRQRNRAASGIFDAITAERPYRSAIPIPHTLKIMAETVGSTTDADCFAVLKLVLERLSPQMLKSPLTTDSVRPE